MLFNHYNHSNYFHRKIIPINFYASNLDWRNFSRYINYMLKEGLIATKGNGYRLTEKGRSLLVKLREISQILSLRQV